MMALKLQPLRGFRDLHGEDMRKFSLLVEKFTAIAKQFSCQQVITPLMEYTDLFMRSLGEESDIVSKEIFTLEDMALKPEGTAGIVRFMASEGISKARIFYVSPHFRRERPQQGRYRQFWQFGMELVGQQGLQEEYDCFSALNMMMEAIGISYRLGVNSIGGETMLLC